MGSKASWTWLWEVWYLLSWMGLAGVRVPAQADVDTGSIFAALIHRLRLM